MTEEKKLSPQERINLLSKKIDEIKELSDHCVILANVEAEGLEDDTFVAAKGRTIVQAQMICYFFERVPKVYKSFQIFNIMNEAEDIITKDTENANKEDK